jgi:hypothetical protein
MRVIKLLFVRLLEEVYFETERKSENIDLDPVIWQILELYLHEIRMVFREAQARLQKSDMTDDHVEKESDGMGINIIIQEVKIIFLFQKLKNFLLCSEEI